MISNWVQLFGNDFRLSPIYLEMNPIFLELIPNILEFIHLFWNSFQLHSKIFGNDFKLIQNILEMYILMQKWCEMIQMRWYDMMWNEMNELNWYDLTWFCMLPIILDSKMFGIEKGDIIMKINEVNTMTPRQNDLVVKNRWKKLRQKGWWN